MIDRATIEKIQEAANIVDVVSEFVTLRKAGANYKGLCPFHNERTPSFMVSPARGICHCFGWGEGGAPGGGPARRGDPLAPLPTAGLVIALNRPISRVMLQAEFAEGWRYVPLLMLAATFGVMTIFFGTFYQALMNSRMLMVTTMRGAVVNVVLGVALVPFMGPWGAGLAGAVAHMLVLVVRARDLRRRINLPIDRLRLTYQLVLLISITACMSFDGGSWLSAAVWACLILLATSDITVLTNSARAVMESLRRRSGGLLRQL